MAQNRDIKYINKDFSDFRNQLIEFTKAYFPDTYNDFTETSPGLLFIEQAAYVGDILSFYQEIQLQETFLRYARNASNLYELAYLMGYRPKVTAASDVMLQVSQRVAATGSDYRPNFDQALVVATNTQIRASIGGEVNFLVDQEIDFSFSSSFDPTQVTVYSQTDGNPDEYLLTKNVRAFSATIQTTTQTFNTAEKFTTITIDNTNIIQVLDIVDSEGNIWIEVPFLGQETIFTQEQNLSNDSGSVRYVLSLQRVPRRFVTRFNSQGQLQIQFGAGILGTDDSSFLPDPTNVGLGTGTGVSRIDYAYNPSNFLYSSTYGLAPSNTTLTIRYLTGGGIQSNVPANTITEILSVNATSVSGDNSYLNTLTFNNEKPAVGGKDGDTIDELRENAKRGFAEQLRVVTLEDFTFRALLLPPRFGTVGKVYVTQDQLSSTKPTTDNIIDSNPLALSFYILAYNIDRNLVTSTPTLKQNLRTYLSQYLMLTDAISIKDAFVVNIGVNFEIIVKSNNNNRSVLLECINKLKQFFNISKWSINQPINLSTIFLLLDQVKGVQTVEKVEIVNKAGGVYSQYTYDIRSATRKNVVYPSLDPMIFEVKFPDQDIKGRVTTI